MGTGVMGGVPGGVPGGSMGGVIGGMIQLHCGHPESGDTTNGFAVSTAWQRPSDQEVQPNYPPLRRQARIKGRSCFTAEINKEGGNSEPAN